jgi:hypothetical protein
MSLPEVTYDDYQAWGGTLAEDAFAASLPHARAAVRDIIGLNVPSGDMQTSAYKAAVCAAVDVDAEYGSTGGAATGGSMTVGTFSVSSGAGSSQAPAYDQDMARAVRGELVGTGLLFQGVG